MNADADPIDEFIRDIPKVFKEGWHIITHPKEQKTDMNKAFRWILISLYLKLLGLAVSFLFVLIMLATHSG